MEQQRIQVFGAKTCTDTARSRHFLDRNRVSYEWIDVDEDGEALAYIQEVNGGVRRTPTIVFPDGSILVEPSNEDLAGKVEM